MINEIQSNVLESQNKELKVAEDSWTGDTQGFEYLYKNKKFEVLFLQIKKHLINYIKHLGVNEDKVD